jgi:RNA polymerase sigma factor (TIGR02999 family)
MVEDNVNIDSLLTQWRLGTPGAEQALFAILYPLLHKAAADSGRRYGSALTLSPTEIVNQAFENIQKQRNFVFANREHFLAIAATIMRRVVIDYLRNRLGRGIERKLPLIPLDELTEGSQPASHMNVDWVGVDQALRALETEQSRACKIVEMKVFAGANNDEIAAALGISVPTVVRDWRFARAWLAQYFESSAREPD